MTLTGPSPAARIVNLRPSAWYRSGRGYTVGAANAVSMWSDFTSNARHVLQSTGANQPILQADGSLLFDGTNDFMQIAFTLVQPTTLYMLVKQSTWTSGDIFCDGFTASSGQILQTGSTPSLSISAGTTACANAGLALATYGVLSAVFSGTQSTLAVNKGAPAAAATTAGTTPMAGFTLGGDSSGANNANMQVKEILIFQASHNQTTQYQVINYLSQVGGLGL